MTQERPKVYIVQRAWRFDRDEQTWIEKFDYSPAAKFGDLIDIFGPGGFTRIQMGDRVHQARMALSSMRDTDYILASGDPCAILIAAQAVPPGLGTYKTLVYDRRENDYKVYIIPTGS